MFVDIKRLRGRHGITLSELAHVSGIPKPTISAIELGRFRLSPEKAERLQRAIELIAEHKRRWRELPKQLRREIKTLNPKTAGKKRED